MLDMNEFDRKLFAILNIELRCHSYDVLLLMIGDEQEGG